MIMHLLPVRNLCMWEHVSKAFRLKRVSLVSHILTQQISKFIMWQVMVGGEVMMGSCGDTPPPTITRHMSELWHLLCQNV